MGINTILGFISISLISDLVISGLLYEWFFACGTPIPGTGYWTGSSLFMWVPFFSLFWQAVWHGGVDTNGWKWWYDNGLCKKESSRAGNTITILITPTLIGIVLWIATFLATRYAIRSLILPWITNLRRPSPCTDAQIVVADLMKRSLMLQSQPQKMGPWKDLKRKWENDGIDFTALGSGQKARRRAPSPAPGKDPDPKNLITRIAVCCGDAGGGLQILQHMIKQGFQLDADCAGAGIAVFGGSFSCSGRNGKRMLALLLSHGGDVNDGDNDGATGLHNAATEGNLGAAKLLLNASADVSKTDNDGNTPLHYCSYHPFVRDVVKIARLLVSKGADTQAKNLAGETPRQMVDRISEKERSEGGSRDDAAFIAVLGGK